MDMEVEDDGTRSTAEEQHQDAPPGTSPCCSPSKRDNPVSWLKSLEAGIGKVGEFKAFLYWKGSRIVIFPSCPIRGFAACAI